MNKIDLIKKAKRISLIFSILGGVITVISFIQAFIGSVNSNLMVLGIVMGMIFYTSFILLQGEQKHLEKNIKKELPKEKKEEPKEQIRLCECGRKIEDG